MGYTPSYTSLSALLARIDLTQLFGILFFIVLAIWAVYTGVVTYHWLRYANRSRAMLPALAVHVIVSLGICMFAVTAL